MCVIEVLWHGRGGQGAFTAARLLGSAYCVDETRYALAFPSFGPERRGAPMRAYTKLSQAPIGNRSACAQADFVIYLDETLLDGDFADELKPGGIVLVNSAREFEDARIIAIDADGISNAILGRPIPNTALLGALTQLLDGLTAEQLVESIREYMPPRLHEKNIAVVDAAIEAFTESQKEGVR